jgi:hypothetical protein
MNDNILRSLEQNSLRSPQNLLDEFSSRRSSFRHGRHIQLADGQTWVIPAPPEGSEWKDVPFEAEYTDVIQTILEAEDSSEQRLAELAFAILLLGHNYRLSSEDYECLLGPTPESHDSTDWQLAFHQFAQDHIHSFLDNARASSETKPLDRQTRFSRLSAWLRNHWPSGWFSFYPRS